MSEQVSGAMLRIGDTIEVWWKPNRDTITDLRPYEGPLAYLFPEGASTASFALYAVGMTIDHSDRFVVLNRAPARRSRR